MRKQIFAQILSVIFGPVTFLILMPYLIVYRETINIPSSLKWEFFSVLFLIVALILLILGRFRGVFSDFDLSNRKEREQFYLVSILLSFLYLSIATFFKGFFFHLSLTVFGIFIGLLIFALVNQYLKASIHMAVACAFVITLTLFYGENTFILIFWLIPLVAWARLVLKKHTEEEILIGSLLGTVVTIATFLIGRNLI